MDKKVLENHKNYLERVAFYRSHGYDLEKERDFILDQSLPILEEILEIGTGKGHFALALAKRGFNFTSVDISKPEQEIAALNLRYFGLKQQVILKTADAAHLSFPDSSFKTLFSVNVFHHLEQPMLVLAQMARLCQPDGKIVLSDFSAKGLEIINDCHAQEGRQHDYFRHRLSQAREYLLGQGFTINEFQSEVQQVIIAIRSNK